MTTAGNTDDPRSPGHVDLAVLDTDHAARMDRIARNVHDEIESMTAPRIDTALREWRVALRTAAVGGALAACAAFLTLRTSANTQADNVARVAPDAAGIAGVPPFVAALLDSADVPAPDALLRIQASHGNVTQVRNPR